MTEHGHITAQMRRDAIDDALAYFNLGERGTRKNVFVHGIVRSFGSIAYVTLTHGRRVSDEFAWLRSSFDCEYDSPDTALIEVPLSFVTIFNIPLFVLDSYEFDRRKRDVEMYNAPYMPHGVPRLKAEKFGSVRI